MWRKLIAMVLALAIPTAASAGPLKDAIDKAGRDLAASQANPESRRGTRFWTGIALIAGGGTMAALSGFEFGDDETGPDDGEDADDSDDGEDSDGWGGKAMIAGGIAAAGLGSILLLKGRRTGPVISATPGRVTVKQTVRF